jgi:hypothetical protein
MKSNEKSAGQRISVTMQDAGRSVAATMARGIRLGLLVAGVSSPLAMAANEAPASAKPSRSLPAQNGAAAVSNPKPEAVAPPGPKRIDFGHESASQDTRQVAGWVVDSGDNRSLPFVIVDKKDAKVFVFNADGRLRGAAPALLGLAHGDDAVPGIGERKLSTILPEERTTPAGRFVAALGHNLHGGEILWVDYATAISLHPVITSNPKERRAQRLATPTPLDNRISYGCINVPVNFYKNVVSPAFKRTNGIVYVLPETRSLQTVFASHDVNEPARVQAGEGPASR